jgi:hypothetical protein
MLNLICFIWLVINPTWAKVEAPNYNFSVDTLSDFFPEKSLSEIEKKYGKPQELKKNGETKMLRFWVAQLRYKFPVIVQVKNDIVLDMFARLPSYFLHDIFHQSLINRWGKQQHYKRVDEEAYYRWENDLLTIHYSASCTITCFPIYFSVSPSAQKRSGDFKPLHEQLNKADF